MPNFSTCNCVVFVQYLKGEEGAVMFAEERRKSIIQDLYKEQKVKTADLVRKHGVSIETIRRDLENLENQGLLKRVHGGAIPAQIDYRQELPFSVRNMKRTDAKKELAGAALQYVSEGQSIALDVSTTNTIFARELKRNFQRLTVLTNSLPILEELIEMPNYTLIFVGGVVRNQEKCTVGDFAESFVAQFHMDTFFMSASGISLKEGITDYGIGETQVKKKMLECAGKTIVLADSSKFEQISLLSVCRLNAIAGIVTDSGLDPGIRQAYQQEGVIIKTPS